MMAQNMTKFTLTIVLLGVALAVAVFRPQILPAEVQGLTGQATAVAEPTPTWTSEQAEDGLSLPADQASPVQDEERMRLDQEWAKLREEQDNRAQGQKDLEQERVEIEVEKARLEQGGEALKAEEASLAQEKEALQDERAQLAEERENLEAEGATLAGVRQDLKVERVHLDEQWGQLRTWEATLLEQEQRVRRLRDFSLAVLSLGSLVVVSLALLVVVAMWKEERVSGSVGDATQSPKLTRQERAVHLNKVPSPTCSGNGGGGNGRGKKEVVRTA
jgi:hypothetical protein